MRRICCFLLPLLLMGITDPVEGIRDTESGFEIFDIPFGLSSHDPILIEGNEDLNNTVSIEGWDGSGTLEDPYVIRDLFIDANGTKHCLSIRNITLPVSVENCTFLNSSSMYSDPPASCIEIFNSSGVRLFDINVSDNYQGIILSDCAGISIGSMDILDNYKGITIEKSRQILINDSRIVESFSSGIVILESSFICVKNLSVSTSQYLYNYHAVGVLYSFNVSLESLSINGGHRGIRVTESVNITGNDLLIAVANIGLYCSFSEKMDFWEIDIRISDTVNGIAIDLGYVSYSRFDDITSNTGDKLMNMWKSDEIIISDIGSGGINYGFYITQCGNIIIERANFSALFGFYILDSNDILLKGFDIITQNWGFYLYNGDNIELEEGRMVTNTGSCIILSGFTNRNSFHNLSLFCENAPSIFVYDDLRSSSFSNISITGVGIDLSNYLLMFTGLEKYLSDNNHFRDLKLNEKTLFSAIDEDLNGKRFGGNFSQIILINASNARFEDHQLESGINDVQIAFSSNIEFKRLGQSKAAQTGISILSSENISVHDSILDLCSLYSINSLFCQNLNISFNELKDSWKSIYMGICEAITLRDNRIRNPDYGLEFDNCKDIVSMNNRITGAKYKTIELYRSNFQIFNDTLDQGIKGFEISDGSSGILSNSKISGFEHSGIFSLNNPGELKIEEVEITACRNGITLQQTEETSIKNSSFRNCGIGIEIVESGNSNVSGSIFNGNEHGIWLDKSLNGNFTDSLFLENIEYAIVACDSRDFNIFDNSFILNNGVESIPEREQCFDDSNNNRWYSPELDRGNHWSDLISPDGDHDGIVDMSYKIAGEGAWSKFPLVFSPIDLISAPETLDIFPGTDTITLTWEVPREIFFGNFTGFKVYRGPSSDHLEEIQTFTGYYRSFTDTDVITGKEYHYQVRAFGTYGIGSPTEMVTGIADNTPPFIEILSPENGKAINTGEVTIIWIAREEESSITGYGYSLDGSPFRMIHNDTYLNISGLQDGSHEVKISVFNDRGLESTSVVDFIVDTTPPMIYMENPQIIHSKNGEFTFSWTSVDLGTGVDRYSYKIDDGSWHSNGLSTSLDVYLQEGEHIILISSTDKVGNSVERSTIIIVDMTEPEIGIIDPLEGSFLRDENISLSLEIFDSFSGLDFMEYDLDGLIETGLPITRELKLPFLEEGSHSIIIRVLDKCGNINEASLNFTIDRTLPRVTDYGPEGQEVSLGEDIVIEFDESLDILSFSMDFIENGLSTWDGNRYLFRPYVDLSPGKIYDVFISVRDRAGNGPLIMEWSFTTTSRGYVLGKVLDEDGDPISGLQVIIGEEPSVFTGEDGSFVMEVGMGQKTVIISGEDIEEIRIDAFILADSELDLGSIEAKPFREDGGITIQWMFPIAIFVLFIIFVLIFVLVIRKRKASRFEFYIDEESPKSEQDEEFEEFWVDLDGEMLSDHYQVLGIPRTSTHAEIKKAYRMMASRFHPDRILIEGEMSGEELADMMALLNDAKEVLLNPARRNLYDAWLHDRDLEM
jgi:DnaJ-domain-containing protein 1